MMLCLIGKIWGKRDTICIISMYDCTATLYSNMSVPEMYVMIFAEIKTFLFEKKKNDTM